MVRFSMLCAGLLLSGAAPALAQAPQPRVLPVSADAAFKHEHSGLTLPATLAGLRRFEVRELEAPQLDIWGRYRNDDSSELTVYVYRTTGGSVPVWFDRAVWAVENRGGDFGSPMGATSASPLVTPGSAVASGLIQSWSLTGGSYTGTSLAIVPIGEWLVKLRYSTTSGDAAAAEERLRAAFAALGWPRKLPSAPAATPVAACTTPLAFAATTRSLPPDPTAMLFGALAGAAASKKAKDTPTISWCRDAATAPMGGVYRANAATDGYLLALSDAGRGVQVYPSVASQIAAEVGKTGRVTSWSVDLFLPGRTINFPLQDALPSPARVAEVLESPAMSSSTTWGKKREINLPSDFGRK